MATENNNVTNQIENGTHPKKRTVNENLEAMKAGQSMLKVRKKPYKRQFVLHKDCLNFGYIDSKKTGMNCSSGPDMRNVQVSDIVEVREGHMTDNFQKRLPKVEDKNGPISEDRCMSIVVGEKHDTLDLIAPTVEIRNQWMRGFKLLLKKHTEANLSQQQDIWMRELFKLADKNGDNVLNLKEIVGLMKHLNIEVDLETAKTVFMEADSNKTRNKKNEDCLDHEEFIKFYQSMTRRDELDVLFHIYNYEGKYLDALELQDFFREEQKQELSITECVKLIADFEPCPRVKALNMMSLDGFHALFNGPAMDIFDHKKCDEIYQDMTQPLSHYYIDSSHNTYLSADQLVGPSKIECFIRALKRGCRCVELDCWDGDNGEPVIYHGHTLTSKIAFKDVIIAVNTYAFEVSEYPVILSIENHCSVEQQRLMARFMTEIFGSKLLKEDLADDVSALPSPEQYKGKIIIKGKKVKGATRPNRVSTASLKAKRLPEEDDSGEVSDEDEAADMECDDTVDEQVRAEIQNSKKKEEKHKLARELSDIVIICRSVGFKGFEHAKQHQNFKQMSSYGERKAKDLLETSPTEWIEHNKRQLSRIYPAGRRTDSSNYEPMPMWLAGNQVVALNYQTPDEDMHIYKGFFMDNGNCGYVLKPEFMRTAAPSNFNPNGPFPPEWKKTLVITIISGYQLPKKQKGGKQKKDILDPYIMLDVLTTKKDYKELRSSHINNNGFHPMWNQTFNFNISVPELAVVRFRVMDYESRGSNVLVAQYCVPFKCMQQGYRTIHLKTKHGEKIWGAQLLVHIDIKDE